MKAALFVRTAFFVKAALRSSKLDAQILPICGGLSGGKGRGGVKALVYMGRGSREAVHGERGRA